MGLLDRIFRRDAAPSPHALYAAIVGVARDPDWYRAGAAPDTLDGRFDMLAAVLAAVLLRLDAEGAAGRMAAVRLTELFVTDMDAQLREAGIGDIVVGKHIGRMMGALGGRLGAYRSGLGAGGDLADALRRNLYRGNTPDAAAVAHNAARLQALGQRLRARTIAALLAGEIG